MDYSNDTRTKKKRRKLIVDTAMDMFYDRGIANTTILDIAAEIGFGRVTIYQYFNSKMELLTYVRELYLNDMYEFEMAIDQSKSGLEQVEEILTKFFSKMLENPKSMLFFWEYIRFVEMEEDGERILPLKNFATHKLLADAIALGKSDKSLDMENVDKRIAMIVEALLATATRIAVKEQFSYDTKTVKIIKEDMLEYVQMMLYGIKY